MTLIELAVGLAIIAILAAVLTPIVTNYVDQARVAAAQSDVKTIAEAISRFEKDVGRYPMFTSGTIALPDSAATVIRLEGPGTTVTDTSGGASNWVNGSVSNTLQAQLLTNAPNYTSVAAGGNLSAPFRWKGPYMDPSSDPWGRRYLVNIANAKTTSNFACFVLSGGPDGKVDTQFDLSKTSAFSAGGDDVIYRIK